MHLSYSIAVLPVHPIIILYLIILKILREEYTYRPHYAVCFNPPIPLAYKCVLNLWSPAKMEFSFLKSAPSRYPVECEFKD
jgi:hypothetical protein